MSGENFEASESKIKLQKKYDEINEKIRKLKEKIKKLEVDKLKETKKSWLNEKETEVVSSQERK